MNARVAAIVEHAREILLHPKDEWQVIAEEPATARELFRSYALPLAAIGPLAATIGLTVFGAPVPFVGHYREPLGSALAAGLVRYALALGGVWLLARVVDALAPRFGARRDGLRALKLAVYASTAIWLAGVFALVPPLAFLGVVGLYSLYLLYTGLPVLMEAPRRAAAAYTVAVVASAIVIAAVVAWLGALLLTTPRLLAAGLV